GSKRERFLNNTCENKIYHQTFFRANNQRVISFFEAQKRGFRGGAKVPVPGHRRQRSVGSSCVGICRRISGSLYAITGTWNFLPGSIDRPGDRGGSVSGEWSRNTADGRIGKAML